MLLHVFEFMKDFFLVKELEQLKQTSHAWKEAVQSVLQTTPSEVEFLSTTTLANVNADHERPWYSHADYFFLSSLPLPQEHPVMAYNTLVRCGDHALYLQQKLLSFTCSQGVEDPYAIPRSFVKRRRYLGAYPFRGSPRPIWEEEARLHFSFKIPNSSIYSLVERITNRSLPASLEIRVQVFIESRYGHELLVDYTAAKTNEEAAAATEECKLKFSSAPAWARVVRNLCSCTNP